MGNSCLKIQDKADGTWSLVAVDMRYDMNVLRERKENSNFRLTLDFLLEMRDGAMDCHGTKQKPFG